MTRIGDAYRWIYGRMASRPTNFSWIIENKLAGCGLPVSREEFEWLHQRGIKTIVTVREVPLPSEWIKDRIDYLHLKVEDFNAPSLEELDAAVDYIDQQISKNKPVMIHCAAGKGRTGTVLAAYLIKKENISAVEAVIKIRKLRSGSIQSQTQEMAITMYEKYLKNKG